MDKINRPLLVIFFIVAIGVSIIGFPTGALAVLFCSCISAITIFVIRSAFKENAPFVINLFLAALLCRVLLATAIYMFDLQGIFGGGDAGTFDSAGSSLAHFWVGELPNSFYIERIRSMSNPGWGMNYLVGIIYYSFGRNQLLIQFLSCVMGAATAPAIYYCADNIFNNKRVAKFAALSVAFFPSMILWSCQMLKDGFITFLLALAMVCITYLLGKFSVKFIIVLMLSLLGILSLRFYVFYVVAVVILASFIIGKNQSQNLILRFGIILLLGIGLLYAGAGRMTPEATTNYFDIDKLKASRDEMARAGSGFGGDIDISTTEGVATILPIGLVYILFAPFPWQMTSLGQLMALPDMILWWSCIPFLISGLKYTFKHRFRSSISILTFTLMLTIAYAIFQGNVGTAYRQRTQIQIFLFIFIGVGFTLRQELKEQNQFLQQRKKIPQNKIQSKI